MDVENKGKIKDINFDRGFGFIAREGHAKDLFFHATQVVGIPFAELKSGDSVVFEDVEITHKGEMAVGVSLA